MCQIIKFCTIQFSFFILTLSSYHASLLFPRHRSNVLFPSHRVNAVEGVTSWLTGLAGSLTTAQWGRRSCSTLLSLLASLPSTVLVGWILRTTIVCRPVKSPDQSPVGDEVVLGCSTITPGPAVSVTLGKLKDKHCAIYVTLETLALHYNTLPGCISDTWKLTNQQCA